MEENKTDNIFKEVKQQLKTPQQIKTLQHLK